MNKHLRDSLVIGFALFSMFFGAGNVIFPPYLGLGSGPDWLVGFLTYYLADIGLALLATFAILRRGSPEGITDRIGRLPSAVLMCAIVLCIGPMLAIPRTAATTYETSLAPLVSGFSPVLFSVLFFLLIFLLCVRETAVVDIVGKILTPALLVGLLVLIIVGVADPIGPVGERPLVDNVSATGIEAGYQTMDVLAAIVFGYIILKSAREKGHTERAAQFRVVSGASLVAGAGLLVVYLGLTYLGATTARFFDLTVDRTYLVVSIVRNLLGNAGILLFSVVVALRPSGGHHLCVQRRGVQLRPQRDHRHRLPGPQCGLSSHFGADRPGLLRRPHQKGLGIPPGGPGRSGGEPAGGPADLYRGGPGPSGRAAAGLSGLRLDSARRGLRRDRRAAPRPESGRLTPFGP